MGLKESIFGLISLGIVAFLLMFTIAVFGIASGAAIGYIVSQIPILSTMVVDGFGCFGIAIAVTDITGIGAIVGIPMAFAIIALFYMFAGNREPEQEEEQAPVTKPSNTVNNMVVA